MKDYGRPEGLKMCSKCGQELPATADYFDVDSSKEGGLRTVCRICRLDAREEVERKKRDERLQMVDDASYKLLEKVARGGSDVPHMAEVYQRIMDVFDGAGGYAAHFMAQYLDATPGSATRTKMLEMLMRISLKVSESGAAQIPIELMSDTDLQNKVEEQARRIFKIEDHVDRTSEKAS